jgi:HAMP domain-containing protein
MKAGTRPAYRPRFGLRPRFLLFLALLLGIAVVSTSMFLSWTARRSILQQTAADGILLANVLARSAEYADLIGTDVEHELGKQMLVEATMAAHLVAIGERARMTPAEINAHLRQIAASTVLGEIWITDETGFARYRTREDVPFTFGPDPALQPQAHAFYPLLTGEKQSVVQEARTREIDGHVFKYAAVAGIDRPRIVQVGYDATFLNELRSRIGVARLVDELVASGHLVAIRVVDRNLLTLAFRAVPGAGLEAASLPEVEKALVRRAVDEGRTITMPEPTRLAVAAPIFGKQNRPRVGVGATLVDLPTDDLLDVMRRQAWVAVAAAAALLLLAVAAAAILARRITGPVVRLTDAAAAVETETCQPADLDDLARRRDELGELARVFQRMAEGVILRERRFREQLRELRVDIDEARTAKQVAEITETDYFKELRSKADALRGRHREQQS